jgi:hypothetical protein
LRRVPGTSDLRGLDAGESRAVLESFMGALGTLHRVDTDILDLPGLARPQAAADHALCDLALWEGLASGLAAPDPMLAFALAWLKGHAPSTVQRTVLVQGDTGPGNFVAEAGRVTGLVDWEFAHLGDPMDDIAWLDMRSGETFGDVAERDRLYEEASGLRVDEPAVRYYTVFVHLRCAITTAVTIERGGGVLGLAAYYAPHHRFLAQLGQALADAMGLRVTTVEIGDGEDTATTALFDHALDRMRDSVLPSLRDAPSKLGARAALLVLEHARALDRLGGLLEDMERHDRAETFGPLVEPSDLPRLATEAGGVGDPKVLDFLSRSAQRSLACWATPAAGGAVPLRSSPRARAG